MIRPPKIDPSVELDKSKLEVEEKLISLEIDAKNSSLGLKSMARYLLNMPRLRRIHNHPSDKNKRLLLMSSEYQDITNVHMDEIAQQFFDAKVTKVGEYVLKISYDYWTAAEIFESVLPSTLDFAASFETIGHIIHLNLRDELAPYKDFIGKVLLDKNAPKIRTVVTKTGNIDTVFRTFPMQVLAGEESYETEVHENNCRFRFDFSKVYWNSRLHTEHGRLIKLFSKEDIIVDVFAGVGPFAIPAAFKCKKVFANDLNPESYKSLNANVVLNKICADIIETFNQDGRVFVKNMVEKCKEHGWESPCFIMNLPADAIQFLDAFKDANEIYPDFSPLIHCYSFTRSETPDLDLVQRAEDALGLKIGSYTTHYVRKVAPNKDMYCLSFSWEKENVKRIKKC